MNYNLVFTMFGLVFLLLLIITLFMKKKIDNVRTKVYVYMIIVTVIYALTEILSLYFLIYLPSSYFGVLFKNINNVCMINIIATFFVYYSILINSLHTKYVTLIDLLKNSRRILIAFILTILVSLFYIVTSIDKVIILDELNFISTTFGFTLLAIVSIILIVSMINLHRAKLHNLFICFLVIFICLSLILPFQLMFTHISFLPVSVMVVIFIVFYFIENPDIELLQNVEKLKNEIDKSSNSKMDFLFNLSYDLVNPINTIVSLSKSLTEMDTLDKELALADLHNIKYAGSSLLDSVNNILDMSSNQDNNNKEYSVVELVKRLRSVIETKIGSKKVTFELNVDQNVNSKLIGDINKIQKVLLNILNNAVNYTDIGKIKMDITATNEKGIQVLNFTIIDTGCGIKEEDKEKVYLDSTEEKSGVGLAISKKYIESMSGSISFTSVYGAGTTFHVSIPQIISGNSRYVDDVILEDENSYDEVIDCSKYKLAIVDDDILDIKVTLKLLKKYNFQIEVINSTIDFINKIKREEKFDLVFLDHKMPVFDGLKTLKSLKQLESYELPKFVCFTANAVNGAREFYLSNGFDEYLSKPIDTNELDRVIKKFCKNR